MIAASKKTQQQLIAELETLYARVAELEQAEADRKRTEEALQASETHYRRLFETAQDGILILDADTGQITAANPFLMELLGYSQEELLGKTLWEIGPFRNIAESRAVFLELQTKGYVRYEDLPLETSDGRLIDVEFVSNVYLVNHSRVIQCNIRDITDRKRTEGPYAAPISSSRRAMRSLTPSAIRWLTISRTLWVLSSVMLIYWQIAITPCPKRMCTE